MSTNVYCTLITCDVNIALKNHEIDQKWVENKLYKLYKSPHVALQGVFVFRDGRTDTILENNDY